MEIRNASDRIWLIVVALLAVLLLACAVRVVAAPADETYERARAALNDEEYGKAIELYREVYEQERERDADVAADALYWRAWAHYKLQDRRHLQQAAELLARQMKTYPESALLSEAQALAARVDGKLAQQGNTRALQRVYEEARGVDDRKIETQMAALNALMRMDPDKALPLLKRILADEGKNPELKRHALMVIPQMDDEAAEEILLQVLQTETDSEMVAKSLFWLARIDSEGAYDAIVKAYRNTDDPDVRRAALMAVGELEDERAADLLIEIARDRRVDTEIRQQAVFALTRTDRDDLADVFKSLYASSDDIEFKSKVLFGITHLDDDVSSDWLAEIITDPDEDDELRQSALHYASRMDLVDVSFLRRVYEADDDPEMRGQVCYALSQVDDPDAVELIIEIVRTEKDPEVRKQAVFWLGQFDDPRVADFLVELIEED